MLCGKPGEELTPIEVTSLQLYIAFNGAALEGSFMPVLAALVPVTDEQWTRTFSTKTSSNLLVVARIQRLLVFPGAFIFLVGEGKGCRTPLAKMTGL